eukprot:1108292_1
MATTTNHATIGLISNEEWSCNEEYVLNPDPTITAPDSLFRNSPMQQPTKKTIKQKQSNNPPDAFNKIVPFIHLSRNVLHCTPVQLKQFISQMIDAFEENEQYDLFTNMLLNGIKSNYKYVPQSIYNKIKPV